MFIRLALRHCRNFGNSSQCSLRTMRLLKQKLNWFSQGFTCDTGTYAQVRMSMWSSQTRCFLWQCPAPSAHCWIIVVPQHCGCWIAMKGLHLAYHCKTNEAQLWELEDSCKYDTTQRGFCAVNLHMTNTWRVQTLEKLCQWLSHAENCSASTSILRTPSNYSVPTPSYGFVINCSTHHTNVSERLA